MIRFSAADRSARLSELESTRVDLLIVGGGITGAGIAWDAALRGLSVVLVEKRDFGWGTSSRSTKLIHGGLRYLKQGDVKLVREVGRERAVLYQLAPHLVHPVRMLLPLYQGGSLGRFGTSIGLWLYDRLANVQQRERRTMHSAEETLGFEPSLRKEGLVGGGMYVEYMTDDARLTLDIMRSAAKAGASVFNYTEVTDFLYDQGKMTGCYLREESGKQYLIKAKKIVNATGPWVDTIREKDNSKRGKQLFLTKGIHIVIPKARLPISQSLYFDTQDGRMVFAIPRGNVVYVGTTDTAYKGAIDHPVATEEDRDYLIAAANHVFKGLDLTPQDVISSWVGLRPLIYQEGKGPSELSRKDEIFISASGLVTIAGGKLTGFRKMAQKVVDLICTDLERSENRAFGSCTTDSSPIVGGGTAGPTAYDQFQREWTEQALRQGLPLEKAREWLYVYGYNAEQVFRRLRAKSGASAVYSAEEMLQAELEYAWDHEMICRGDDFLIRRTGSLFFQPDRYLSDLSFTVQFLAEKQGWSEQQVELEKQRLTRLFHEATFSTKSNHMGGVQRDATDHRCSAVVKGNG